MTQKAIAELYQTSPQNITLHIKNIYEEDELGEKATCKYFLQVQNEGSRKVERKAMDDDRLKEMRNFGQDYFDELLERIRDIRASEKRFYQKITDIYATSVDYDSNADITQDFFATVQNKLHFAIHGKTAAELIADRAKAENENMSLTSWKGDQVRRRNVTVAKNYISEKELKSLNRIVTMYLDYAEDQAERQRPMYMNDWVKKLDAFLQFNEREILHDAGRISKVVADSIAVREYETFNQQRIEKNADDDFERFINQNNLKK